MIIIIIIIMMMIIIIIITVSSLSIIMYTYNENLAQIMCHNVYKQIPSILVYRHIRDGTNYHERIM